MYVCMYIIYMYVCIMCTVYVPKATVETLIKVWPFFSGECGTANFYL